MEISFLCKDRTSIDTTTNEGNECASISFANKKVTTGRRKTIKKSAKSEIRFIGFAYNKQHIFPTMKTNAALSAITCYIVALSTSGFLQILK